MSKKVQPERSAATPLLTVAEVAIRLSCSRSNVIRLIDSGKLRGYSIGNGKCQKDRRVPEEAIAEFLEASACAINESVPVQEASRLGFKCLFG